MTAPALVLMMAGGTGGHVFPALAVATELRARGHRVAWVGTRRGLEHRVVPAAGIDLHCLAVRGVRGKGVLDRLLAIGLLGVAALQALWLVGRLWPRCVVGMGGYASGPAGIAAWLLRRPLLIQEQNAVAGTTNRMLAPLADLVAAGFPGAFRSGIDCRVLGNPVRRELVEAGAGRRYDYSGGRPLRLLVLGGSLGAQAINRVVPGALRRVVAGGGSIEVLHQAGDAHADEVRAAYGEQPSGIRIEPFIADMAAAYRWADLVLCRAGALTVSELAVMGCPAILVPLPTAIDDHQRANALALSERGGAMLLPQGGLTEERLAEVLGEFMARPAQLAAMAVAATAAALPDATDRVCNCCEALIDGR